MAEIIDGTLELGRVTRGEMQHTEVDLTALAQAAVNKGATFFHTGEITRCERIEWGIITAIKTLIALGHSFNL